MRLSLKNNSMVKENKKKTTMKETTVINIIMDSQLWKCQILVTNLNVSVLGDYKGSTRNREIEMDGCELRAGEKSLSI